MWTKEQLEAINITDVNTTVSASAGAGKTAVLVERLMKRIIKDGVSVDEIVSLTFTDAAAAEMKNRLMASLLKAYEEDPNNEYLYEQITLIPSANISTIHSFCLNLLKDYYYVLGLDPESLNNIIDEAEDLNLHKEAFNHVMEVYDTHKIADVMQIISGSAMSIERLNALIKDLITKANATTDPKQFLYNSVSIYRKHDSIKDLPEPFNAMLWTYHNNKFNELKNATFALLYELDNISDEKNTEHQEMWLHEAKSLLDLMEDDLNQKEYQHYVDHFSELASIENKTITKEPTFKGLRDQYFEVLTELATLLFDEEEVLNQLAQNETELKYLIEMALIYNDYYKQGIKDLNKITFNDMETLTYELLCSNDGEIAKEVSLTISDILVDEFQDTNELQDKIIKLISNGNNIFRVGDVKQSIYRFRGAKPEIMQDLITQENSDKHQTIYLSNNFRSKESIVEYNNHFFSQLMNLPSFNSSYLENDVVAAGTEGQKEDSVPVELHRININKEDADSFTKSLSANEMKAHYIASKIVELYDASEDKKWNRFTVLVNSHNRKIELKAAFDKANIPYFISLPDGLYTSAGVSLVVAYLKLVYDPSDKISLMAILKNLYHYSDNQITELFLKHDKDLYKVANELNEEVLDKVNFYHLKQDSIPVMSIVRDVLEIHDFYEQGMSKQNRTNLDIFIEIVTNYDKEHLGVYGLLKQIELANNARTQEGSSISSEDNVVNVMTIHNSKGLQFETVFLMSKQDNRSPQSSQGYLLHPNYGLGIKSIDTKLRTQSDNIAYYLIKYFDEREAIEEEMRKLYVALTRAQKELYVVDDIKIKEDELPEVMDFNEIEVAKKSYTHWMESVHHHKPSSTMIYHLEESLVLQKTDALELVQESIEKFDDYTITKQEMMNGFKVGTLDFSQESLATDIGTLVHNTMEEISLDHMTYETIKALSPTLSNYYINRIVSLGADPFFKQLISMDVYREFPFIVEVEDRRQRGIIDFFVEGEHDIYILDFKTDSLDDEVQFIERYEKQLNFYEQALSQHYTNKTIHKYIYSFKLQSFIKID